MRPINARSRKPTTELVSMESSRARASSLLSTGVLPFFTTYFGPRTAWAGFVSRTWPVTSQSNTRCEKTRTRPGDGHFANNPQWHPKHLSKRSGVDIPTSGWIIGVQKQSSVGRMGVAAPFRPRHPVLRSPPMVRHRRFLQIRDHLPIPLARQWE